MALDPDPWELPPEVATRKKFTSTELLDAVNRFASLFDYQIPIGFGISPVATPVIEYAIKHKDPKFFFDWEKRMSTRIAEHRIVL